MVLLNNGTFSQASSQVTIPWKPLLRKITTFKPRSTEPGNGAYLSDCDIGVLVRPLVTEVLLDGLIEVDLALLDEPGDGGHGEGLGDGGDAHDRVVVRVDPVLHVREAETFMERARRNKEISHVSGEDRHDALFLDCHVS